MIFKVVEYHSPKSETALPISSYCKCTHISIKPAKDSIFLYHWFTFSEKTANSAKVPSAHKAHNCTSHIPQHSTKARLTTPSQAVFKITSRIQRRTDWFKTIPIQCNPIPNMASFKWIILSLKEAPSGDQMYFTFLSLHWIFILLYIHKIPLQIKIILQIYSIVIKDVLFADLVRRLQ